MSGTFSPPRKPADIEIFSEYGTTLVSTAHSGKTQRRRRGGHTWRFRCNWAPLTRANYSDVMAYLIDQDGQYETWSFILPDSLGASRGSWAGTPLVNGTSQTDTPVNCDGFTNSAANVVKTLDFFKFAGHSKVYAATAAKSANGSGQISLAFKPHLIATPADNEAITHASVPFTVALATDLTSFKATPPAYAPISIDLVEVW